MENAKANILKKINGYIVNCTLSGINNEIEKLLTIVSEYEASQELATLFLIIMSTQSLFFSRFIVLINLLSIKAKHLCQYIGC